MPLCMVFAGIWCAMALLALLLSPAARARAIWPLIASGIPVLGFLTLQAGPVWGLAGLAVAALLLGNAMAEAVRAQARRSEGL